MALGVVSALVMAGCAQAEVGASPPQQTHTGIPDRGGQAIQKYGCGTCHTIPGIKQADGLVGPPLTRFARRSYIAGELPNNAENLQRWIENPQTIEPGTAMPDLGVTPSDSQDITAYLYTLK
jgi:cytochrome c